MRPFCLKNIIMVSGQNASFWNMENLLNVYCTNTGWWKWIIPFIYFVTECMTTSAPRDRGLCKRIVAVFYNRLMLQLINWSRLESFLRRISEKIVSINKNDITSLFIDKFKATFPMFWRENLVSVYGHLKKKYVTM